MDDLSANRGVLVISSIFVNKYVNVYIKIQE